MGALETENQKLADELKTKDKVIADLQADLTAKGGLSEKISKLEAAKQKMQGDIDNLTGDNDLLRQNQLVSDKTQKNADRALRMQEDDFKEQLALKNDVIKAMRIDLDKCKKAEADTEKPSDPIPQIKRKSSYMDSTHASRAKK